METDMDHDTGADEVLRQTMASCQPFQTAFWVASLTPHRGEAYLDGGGFDCGNVTDCLVGFYDLASRGTCSSTSLVA